MMTAGHNCQAVASALSILAWSSSLNRSRTIWICSACASGDTAGRRWMWAFLDTSAWRFLNHQMKPFDALEFGITSASSPNWLGTFPPPSAWMIHLQITSLVRSIRHQCVLPFFLHPRRWILACPGL
jgi:hypothetical protein